MHWALVELQRTANRERRRVLRVTDTPLTRTIASTATLKIAGLFTLDLLYTPLEERFERITRLARRALRVPVAGISLLDDRRQWFKSLLGWEVSEIPRQEAVCRWTVAAGTLVTIGDLRQDPRTRSASFVTSPPHFLAYAGHPLLDQHGFMVGTFCVFDTVPREFTASELQALRDSAAMAQRELLSTELLDAHATLASKLGAARRAALMDPLTHLWNRRGADSLLKTAFAQSDERGTPLTLAVVDLDNFKEINDRHGHPVGDEVLRKIAGRMLGAVRGGDTICRIGGDEFLILMNDTDHGVGARVADRVRRAVTDTPLASSAGPISVSLCIGATVREPHATAPPEAFIERADRALMESKAAGRNRVSMTR